MPHVTAQLYCSICMMLEDGCGSWDWVSLIACGHMYHDLCVRKWCEQRIPNSRRKQNTCPDCRTKILRVPSLSHDDRSYSQLSKNNTRFKKLILNVKEEVVHSSSPVRRPKTSSPPAAALTRKNVVKNNIIESSEESEQEEEEEEDENAGPAGNASGAGNARQQRENQRIIGEMRALITSKNAELEAQSAQLAEHVTQLADLRDELHASKAEFDDVLRRREVYMAELKEAKKEKAQLGRNLEKEVARHQSTRTHLNQLTNEISTLKQEKQDLQRRHKSLSELYEEHLSGCEERTKHLEAARAKFEKLHRAAASGNTNLKLQHDKERTRRKEAEAKLAHYTAKESTAGQSAKKVDKGKKRMIYQDEDEEEEDSQRAKKEEEEDEDDFEIPMASTSTSMSRSRIGVKDYDVSAEDSLQIDDYPHSRRMDLQDGYEQDNFDDLDSIHPISANTNAARQNGRPPRRIIVEVSTRHSREASEQKENIVVTKKRGRELDILVEVPNKMVKSSAKDKDKEKSKSQEYMNQVLTQNNKTLALGDKKRSKYFHK